jgi:pimeloyl-ACP methyl ester carboxylesterase
MRPTRLLFALGLIVAFVLGALAYRSASPLTTWFSRQQVAEPWPEGFTVVEIESRIDHTRQKAIFSAAKAGPKRPLLVSLHVWGGDYSSRDGLAHPAARLGWNYIHPDFRGPNRGTDNCLSEKVIADIEDAIDYGVRAGNADPENIFVVGFSGGGYAALGVYARSARPVRAFLAWAPIADLAAWHEESTARGNFDFAREIRNCTGSGEHLARDAARLRSPLYWSLAATPKPRIELYAGINDGYSGTVPISHSIRFFNRLAEVYSVPSRQVSAGETATLLSRGVATTAATMQIAGRAVLFHRDATFASLTIFQGSHEMPAELCFSRLESLVRRDVLPGDYKPWE